MLSKISSKLVKKHRKKSAPDIYVVSYPKSGRTWLRFMLCHYLIEKYNLPKEDIGLDIEKATSEANIPTTNFTHDQSAMIHRLIYSSMEFNTEKFRGKRVLLLGREIKDTLVSAYYQVTKRINVFEGTMSEFIRSETFGAKKICQF